jgi:hypothetical protein
MRRILTTALASSLLALAIPAAASAHHGSRHRHHRRHHAHTVVFSPSARRSDTPSVTQTPATEQVATVASFEGGVLKLTLADGSTVSGKVTENTEIGCGCDGHHFEDGPQDFGHDNGDDHGDDHPGFFRHDDEQGQMGERNCGVSSLVLGSKVKEAELNVSGAGTFWEQIELLPQS